MFDLSSHILIYCHLRSSTQSNSLEVNFTVLNSEDDNRLGCDYLDRTSSDYVPEVEVVGERAFERNFFPPITGSYPTAPTTLTTLSSECS